MTINAIPLGCWTPLPQDVRATQGSPVTNVAQAVFSSGRAVRTASAVAAARPRSYLDFEDSGVLAVGDTFYIGFELTHDGWFSSTSAGVFIVQGDRVAAWQHYDTVVTAASAIGISIDNTGSVTAFVYDANLVSQLGATVSLGSLRQGAPYIRTWVTLALTKTSNTVLTLVATKTNIPESRGGGFSDFDSATLTLTDVSDVGTTQFQSARWGASTNIAKGDTVDMRAGDVFVSGAAMPSPAARCAYVLPTGDGATNEWLKLSGGAASFTEVDDAFGSYSTADGNTTGSVTAQKTTIETFPTYGDKRATIKLVGLNAASDLNASAIDTNRVLGVATEAAITNKIEKDMTLGKAALQTNGAQIRWFEKRGDNSAWTPATVDSDTVYVRKLAVGAANEWRVFAFGKLVWYEAFGVARAAQLRQAVSRASRW